MATGVYAPNMEIEMLKKELAKEQERLSKAARGERISPPRVRNYFKINRALARCLCSSPSWMSTVLLLSNQWLKMIEIGKEAIDEIGTGEEEVEVGALDEDLAEDAIEDQGTMKMIAQSSESVL